MILDSVIIKFLIAMCLTIAFYKYIRGGLISYASNIVGHLPIRKKYPLSKITNVISLMLTAIFHIGFVFLILWITKTSWAQISILTLSPILWLDGILLGISISGISALLCQLLIPLIQKLNILSKKSENNEFSVSTKNGLMRQFYDAKEICPLYLLASIIVVQAVCEEVIFRGAYMHYFIYNGKLIAIVLSTFLFILMESFFTPSRLHGLFPMAGAAVMGLTHGYLITIVPSLLPLIISQSVISIFILM